MKTATITSTVDLTEGGCNACGITKCVVYTLAMDDWQVHLEELTVTELVMTILLKNGWQQATKYDIFDEYTVYQKTQQEVRLEEEYDEVTYKNATNEITTINRLPKASQVFTIVNQILSELFDMDEIYFEGE